MGRADARRAREESARRARSKGKKSGIRRFFTWKKLLGAFLGVCLLGILGFIGLYLCVDIPKGNNAAKLQSNVYKYANGKVMARTGLRNRENVPLSRIPKDVQRTFVAAENKNFYHDSGVDLMGTMRGIFNTVMGRGKQGGSTITQQYVKNYYLSQEQTVSRKLQEIVISLKVDNKYSKGDILAGYINTSYYGRGAYGIQAAAQAYYGVDVEKLTVSQGAYLASLLQAPNQYDWTLATDAGKKRVQERWAYTLDNMVEMKWLSPEDRRKQTFQRPKDPKPLSGVSGQTNYLVEQAKQELFAQGVDEKQFAAGGWTVTLGIDKNKQKALEASVKRKLLADLDPKKRKVDADAQLGATSVDPKTGHIVAMYGGEGPPKHYRNNATRSDYQAASTFKPLILASAMENNAVTQDGVPITPNTIYDGRNRRPVVGGNIAFAPPNEDEHEYGKISVQTATNNSVNAVFAQMGADVGLDKVKQTAVSLGMADTMDVKPAMTLGTMGASPLQMAGAYATLDNHGKKVTPTLVTQATHSVNGVETKVPLKDPIGDQVLSRKTADTVTSVLTGVVNDGTASQAVKNTAYKAAGKTGTSDDDKSAWFVGYTPKLVTAVGMFGESPNGGRQVTLKNAGGDGRVNGGGYPAKVWADYTEAALNGDTGADFDLDTNMGAAIPPTPTPTPSHTPSSSPSPSKSPSDSPSPTPSKPSGPPSPTHSGRPSPPVPSDSGSPDGGADGGAAGGDGGPGGGTGGETGGTRPDSLPGFG
ncbi:MULTISPECIES: transglycosylase domain-containing protein [unclassified Streptomyces]|uniref:transglycosylase domain-containing protein n=1 Tax=unclassified Streptomyces TaxID=2593676 RepID=UPI000888DD2F|nr:MULTISPECIES: transglycosylase domain-containing protein [unclassified Streptomyces]PBC84810.1 membrane peptidoglycan carboxypeptidase [Streptomyces sp. 2321.6]SDR26309.1 Membrane carboxypeptidase (penicillin-binding protein) [Streptomyces sp. KS_16]SED45368.1 Membrane carboxypeptidase (penicillin-binding protein) [Streptomyces sp. 2133.1]SEE41399.1 Membrane carboxypeptidase (penicillin-binding protein) [Streptomyces sp. 2112.3]SNC70833.1 Membrane carboxypeptidase (penicillin-binding protei